MRNLANTATRKVLSISADGVIKNSRGHLLSVAVTGSGAAGTAILYDNASAASGKVIATLRAPSGDTVTMDFYGAIFDNGIYVDLTTAEVTVVFD